MKTYKIVKAKNNKALVGEEITMEIVKKQSKSSKTKQLLNSKYVTHEEFDSFRKEVNNKFDSIEKKFDSIDNKFDSIDKKFDSIDKKFDSIEKKFDILFKHLGINE